jgi:hypothetical protein
MDTNGDVDEALEAMEMANQVCALLRTKRSFWKDLIQHLPSSTGSLATQLLIILDGQNVPFCPRAETGADIDALTIGMVHELTKQGVSAQPSRRMAAALINYVVKINMRTVATCHTLAEHSTDAKFVLRVALKSVRKVRMNPSTNTVWFRDGHANLAFLDTEMKMLYFVEPTATEIIEKLDKLLAVIIIPDCCRRAYRIIHNFNMFARGSAIAQDDNMCTAWCAITAMMMLCNRVHSPESFWVVAECVQHNRTQLLGQFFIYACQVLKKRVLIQQQSPIPPLTPV